MAAAVEVMMSSPIKNDGVKDFIFKITNPDKEQDLKVDFKFTGTAVIGLHYRLGFPPNTTFDPNTLSGVLTLEGEDAKIAVLAAKGDLGGTKTLTLTLLDGDYEIEEESQTALLQSRTLAQYTADKMLIRTPRYVRFLQGVQAINFLGGSIPINLTNDPRWQPEVGVLVPLPPSYALPGAPFDTEYGRAFENKVIKHIGWAIFDNPSSGQYPHALPPRLELLNLPNSSFVFNPPFAEYADLQGYQHYPPEELESPIELYRKDGLIWGSPVPLYNPDPPDRTTYPDDRYAKWTRGGDGNPEYPRQFENPPPIYIPTPPSYPWHTKNDCPIEPEYLVLSYGVVDHEPLATYEVRVVEDYTRSENLVASNPHPEGTYVRETFRTSTSTYPGGSVQITEYAYFLVSPIPETGS